MLKALVAAALVCAPIAVQAAPSSACVPAEEVARYLITRYGEHLIGTRPAKLMSKLQLYASVQGTWTILHTDGKQACIIAAGKDWQVPQILLGTPA